MIISLIGFMGAGKTTLGKQLAQSLRCPFLDLDSYIEEKEGHTIREIFDMHGEDHFRKLEEKYLEDVLEDHVSQHPETLDDIPSPDPIQPDNHVSDHPDPSRHYDHLRHCERSDHPDPSRHYDHLRHCERSEAIHPNTLDAIPSSDADSAPISPRRCTLVISLGGGIVTNPSCCELISRFTYCIYLKTDLNTLFQRLEKDSSDRPMLTSDGKQSLRETITRLYHQRTPLYEQLAQKIISVAD